MVTVMSGFWSPMCLSCFCFKYNDRHCIYHERKMKHAWMCWGLTFRGPGDSLCSYVIYTVTIIVFEVKARYVHWTSESTHYGHHLRLVVIIQSRAHRTTLYLLMTWLVDQLNAPRGTSSVASHYLTTIVPTCRLVSTLHLHSYKIHKIHSYKKQSWWWWCACHPAI